MLRRRRSHIGLAQVPQVLFIGMLVCLASTLLVAWMQALMDVVACIEIAAQHSFELAADQLFDHFACPRVMVLIVANAGGTHCPDVTVAAIFAPSCLIGLDRWTGADLLLEGIQGGLHVLLDPMQQFDDLADAHPEAMHGPQVVSQLPKG